MFSFKHMFKHMLFQFRPEDGNCTPYCVIVRVKKSKYLTFIGNIIKIEWVRNSWVFYKCGKIEVFKSAEMSVFSGVRKCRVRKGRVRKKSAEKSGAEVLSAEKTGAEMSECANVGISLVRKSRVRKSRYAPFWLAHCAGKDVFKKRGKSGSNLAGNFLDCALFVGLEFGLDGPMEWMVISTEAGGVWVIFGGQFYLLGFEICDEFWMVPKYG